MKKIILAVAVAAIATMAVVSSASAGVERYQTQSMTITAVQPEGSVGQWTNVWKHTYNVTLNPCDNTFSGTGTMTGTLNGPISNTLIATAWDSNDNVIDTSPNVLEFHVSATTPIATSHYRNHGDYVSQAGDKADAAHSCIGMPTN